MKPDEALLLIGHSIACTLLDAQGPKAHARCRAHGSLCSRQY